MLMIIYSDKAQQENMFIDFRSKSTNFSFWHV